MKLKLSRDEYDLMGIVFDPREGVLKRGDEEPFCINYWGPFPDFYVIRLPTPLSHFPNTLSFLCSCYQQNYKTG